MTSSSESFLFLISVLEVKYDIPSDMGVIDKLRLFVKSDVYSIFHCLYNQTSYIWMQLGFRPSLNRDSMHQERISVNLKKMPPELVRIVSSFIPKNNYLVRRRQLTCNMGLCVSCDRCHSIRKNTYRAIRVDMIQARRDVSNATNQSYGPHRASRRTSSRNSFDAGYDITATTPLFTEGYDQRITTISITTTSITTTSITNTYERPRRIQRHMPYARQRQSRRG